MPIQQLIGVLERMKETHEVLLGLAERKKEALVLGDVDEVSAIVNKETKLARTVDELLKEQAAAVNAFFQSRGLHPTRAVTVTELMRLVADQGQKDALAAARDRLSDIIGELRKANDLNQQLVQQSLAFVNYSIDLVVGPDEEPIYRKPTPGQQGSQRRTGYFDSRV